MDEQRELLAKLMGTADPHAKDPGKNLKFSDDQICKSYIVGCCPAHLFHGTKLDSGGCGKVHSDLCKQRYHDQPRRDFGYEEMALEILEGSVGNCDRKIVKSNTPSLQKYTGGKKLETEASRNSGKINKLNEEIKEYEKQIEEAQKENNTTTIDYCRAKIEGCKINISTLKEGTSWCSERDRQINMVMCEVCGAILREEEVGSDSAMHYGGRVHMAFQTMRDFIPKLKQEIEMRQFIKNKQGAGNPDSSSSESSSSEDSESSSSDSSAVESKSKKRSSKKKPKSKQKRVKTKKAKSSTSSSSSSSSDSD